MRATISVGPPAATGTMRRTGLFGKSPFVACARAARVKRVDAKAGAAQRAIKRRRVSMAVPRALDITTLSRGAGPTYSGEGRACQLSPTEYPIDLRLR